jgi:ArsR family transcriptional regulator
VEIQDNEVFERIRQKFDDNRCAKVAQLMSVMSNPVRFHILCALSCQSFTVSELVELTGAKTSNVSQQLKIMLLAGYLVKQRRGKKIYYELKEKRITFLLDQLEDLYPVES